MTMPIPQPALPMRASTRDDRRAADVADFDAFYQAHVGDLVAMAFGLTGDRAEAQDLALAAPAPR
jgi:DNA-directed RNA polymerase specialized sigma24 family protein